MDITMGQDYDPGTVNLLVENVKVVVIEDSTSLVVCGGDPVRHSMFLLLKFSLV